MGWPLCEKREGPVYSDAVDDGNRMHGQYIWLPDIQADFAARMDWCVMDYELANHYPILPESLPGKISASPGELVPLDASGCTDPDGDRLSYRWWHYNFAEPRL